MDIVPFGKYKGQPITAMVQDKQYIEWLQSQSWFLERYQSINTLIINNFGEPSETPEHNTIQALFTDDSFCIKLVQTIFKQGIFELPTEVTPIYALRKKYIPDVSYIYSDIEFNNFPGQSFDNNKSLKVHSTCPHNLCKPFFSIKKVEFEEAGLDVRIDFKIHLDDINYYPVSSALLIEIKPSLSDDYPAVLRQMKSNKAFILVTKQYTGVGATFEQVCKIFSNSQKHIVVIPSKYF